MQKKEDTCHPSTFKNFYEQQGEALYNYLYYKSGETGFAEDTVQESFIRLWKNCSKVPLSKAKSFLYTTATNLFRDMLKHKKVQLKFRQRSASTSTAEDPSFILEEQEFKEKLEAVINSLPEDQRTVFLMNRIDQLKYREIAELLGVSQKTVEKRMHKALLILREKIGNI